MTKAKSETTAAETQPDTLLQQTTDHPVDRGGYDFGGSTGKTTAGLGLGLGDDASDNPVQRSLPGRRAKAKLSKPKWGGPDTQ